MKKLIWLAVALVPTLLATRAQAAPSRYGMVGLTGGQTLRINVGNPDLIGNPDLRTGVPPDPCRAELSFVDDAGRSLLPAVQFTLRRGTSTHYDLNGDQIVPPGPPTTGTVNLPAVQRAEVRPVVLTLIPPGPPDRPASACVSSIEILDNATGRTLLTSGPENPGVRVGFNPQPDPPKIFGQLGLVAGQTIRLGAVNVLDPGTTAFPPDPCRVTLLLLGPDGGVLARSTEVIRPGASTFLDFALPASTTGENAVDVAAAARVEVRAVVRVESLGTSRLLPPDPCRATLQLIDDATAHTTALQSPQAVELAP